MTTNGDGVLVRREDLRVVLASYARVALTDNAATLQTDEAYERLRESLNTRTTPPARVDDPRAFAVKVFCEWWNRYLDGNVNTEKMQDNAFAIIYDELATARTAPNNAAATTEAPNGVR